ncbi:MAG: hypothetical protein H8D23_38350 [Candidatus Brocadiales bacterium]|nr:hypothetical protein [Candidatus Brocadiales bacterium]
MRSLEISLSSWRVLQNEWKKTLETWQDNTTDYYERTFWRELECEMKNFSETLEQLDISLKETRNTIRDL